MEKAFILRCSPILQASHMFFIVIQIEPSECIFESIVISYNVYTKVLQCQTSIAFSGPGMYYGYHHEEYKNKLFIN